MRAILAVAVILALSGCVERIDQGKCLEERTERTVLFRIAQFQFVDTRHFCTEWEFPNGRP